MNKEKNPKMITQILGKMIGSVIKMGFFEEGDVADSTDFITSICLVTKEINTKKMISHIVLRKK